MPPVNDNMLDTILITEEIMASIIHISNKSELSCEDKNIYMSILASSVYSLTAFATFVLNEGPIDAENREYLVMVKRDLIKVEVAYCEAAKHSTETLPKYAELIANMDSYYSGILESHF